MGTNSITSPVAELHDEGSLMWPPLVRGILVQRYKRFLADVRLRNNHLVTVHCPNSGSMLTCSEPGRTVFLSRHNLPHRRLKYTWEMIEMPGSLVGVNTQMPNRLIQAAVLAGQIPELSDFQKVRREVKYGENSRIDLLLETSRGNCYVEIKNCTLVRDGTASFPDAVTERGLKHLRELARQVGIGVRSVIFFLVQRMDARRFSPADGIDPAYGRGLREAVRAGVEMLVYDVFLDEKGIRLNRPLPFDL